MVLDTGASSVVLTTDDAKAAGLPLDLLNYTVSIDTANGRTRAAPVTLDRIAIGQDVTASVDTYPGVAFTGKIAAINPKVDANSRNVAIRAQLANPDHKLVPGMYATIAIAVGATQPYVTLPQTAVTYNPYGSTVFLVVQDKDASGKEQLTAHQSFVTTGQTRGDQVAITSGVKAGDTVISAGQLKLRNGSRLIVNNSVQPANDANPTPADQ